jgi:hypothetical protein
VVWAVWANATIQFARTADGAGTWAVQALPTAVSPAFGVGLTHYKQRVYLATQATGGGPILVWNGDDAANITFASKSVLAVTDPFDVLVDPANGDLWAVTDTTTLGVAKSTDGGSTFPTPLVETTNPNTSQYTDWVFAKDRMVLAGDSAEASILDPATPFPRKAFTVEAANNRTRSITTDSAGNAIWVYGSGVGVKSGRLAAGKTTADAAKVVDALGASPHAKIDVQDKALIVAYTKAGSVVVTVVAP